MRKHDSRTKRTDSLRQRALMALSSVGPMRTKELAEYLDVDIKRLWNSLASLRTSRKIVFDEHKRLTVSRPCYVRPPENRIDIAGPAYARGYRW